MSSDCCVASSVLPSTAAKIASATVVADAGRGDTRTCESRVEAHWNGLAGVGGARAGDDEHCLRPTLPCRHRLVAQVGISREDRLRLQIGILGKVAQDENDLVLDVEASVAVVSEILSVRYDEAVADEDHSAGDVCHCPRSDKA